MKALQQFALKQCRWPAAGEDTDAVWTELQSIVELLNENYGEDAGLNLPLTRDHVQELVRLGGMRSELHAVSSVVGGIASQEVIKLITRQFIPVDNTFVYNGVCSVGGCYTF